MNLTLAKKICCPLLLLSVLFFCAPCSTYAVSLTEFFSGKSTSDSEKQDKKKPEEKKLDDEKKSEPIQQPSNTQDTTTLTNLFKNATFEDFVPQKETVIFDKSYLEQQQ